MIGLVKITLHKWEEYDIGEFQIRPFDKTQNEEKEKMSYQSFDLELLSCFKSSYL